MAEFFASGLVVDAILALMVLQFALLCVLRIVIAKAPPRSTFCPRCWPVPGCCWRCAAR